MTDFDQFERRLAAALRSDADESVDPFEAGQIARSAIAGTRPPRRFGRGRGMTLLAAAALLLVGGALAAGSGLLRLPTVVPPVPEPSVIAVATASPDATSPSPSESAAPSASPIPVAGPGGVWIPTGSMVTPRYDFTAVRLLDGRVLVAGGSGANNESDLTSAELYDPDTGTWSATGNMVQAHVGFPATLLPDGKVLVGDELYDAATGSWFSTGKLVTAATTATLLANGKVLATGSDGAQLYDPDSGTWTATGKMITPWRQSHTATLLPDGKVLVAGGADPFDHAMDSAELYDPDTGSWTSIANMHARRATITATLLRDGKVLVYGGTWYAGESFSSELYDPATGVWTVAGDLARPDAKYRTATLLLDGTVLVAGGLDGIDAAETAEVYDPATRSWIETGSLLRTPASAWGYGPATLLLDGTVLVAGGSGPGPTGATGSAELYVPASVSPPVLGPFPSPTPSPSPTPIPTPFPPAAGPVPAGARSWKVMVDNKSSEPLTRFVAEADEHGMLRLVGSATPNVVPVGATVEVTFLFPAKWDPDDGWVFVNPRPGDDGGLVGAGDIGIPGKILIGAEGDGGWLSP